MGGQLVPDLFLLIILFYSFTAAVNFSLQLLQLPMVETAIS
jgi:hypothetical protein